MAKYSLCIPTTNVTREMLETINNFYLVSNSSIEVVVVFDGTLPDFLIEAFSFFGKDLKLISLESKAGPAHARNIAARKSSGNKLIFVDSDVVVPASVFSFLTEVNQGNVHVPAALPLGVTSRASNFFSDFALAPKVINNTLLPVSACFSILRSEFLESGGFDENFKYPAGEDWEFFRRVQVDKLKITFNNKFRVFHRNPRTTIGIAKRSYRYARHGADFNERNIDISVLQAGKNHYSIAPIIYLPSVVLIGFLKILFSTLSVDKDWFSRFSSKIQVHQEKKLRTILLLAKRGRASKSVLGRLGYVTVKLANALTNFPTESPWSGVVPVREDISIEQKKRYRFLVAIWRFTYIIGYMNRVRAS